MELIAILPDQQEAAAGPAGPPQRWVAMPYQRQSLCRGLVQPESHAKPRVTATCGWTPQRMAARRVAGRENLPAAAGKLYTPLIARRARCEQMRPVGEHESVPGLVAIQADVAYGSIGPLEAEAGWWSLTRSLLTSKRSLVG